MDRQADLKLRTKPKEQLAGVHREATELTAIFSASYKTARDNKH
jgi:hypothetical protein